jgi:fengycin family lipopeptide synthetase D
MSENTLYPLSLPQEAFYFDYLLNRNDCKYTMGGALILDGDLNIELYRSAYNFAIAHYDAMRITFVKKGDELYQQFRQEYKCEIAYSDFRNHDTPVQDALESIVREGQKPLPIESDDLYSEMVVRTDEKRFILAPRFHHMVCDGMGKAILNQAVADTYNSLLERGCFPELKAMSYIDFIHDDLRYRQSDAYKDSSEYWKRKLAHLPEPLAFTAKKKSIKSISLHTERIALNMHRICFESILNIAGETNATTFQVILGLMASTLYRCYNRNELVIGIPVLNRSNHRFRHTPGLFMNMMPLRLTIAPEGTFEDVVHSIKSALREGYRHQRFPLRDTIRHLRSGAEFNHDLFDVTVVYRNHDLAQRFGGAHIRTTTFDTGLRNESLSMEIDEYDQEGDVNIFFNYNPLVIPEEEQVQFVHCFETMLMDIIHFPDKRVREIALLNAGEMHKILHEFNSSADRIATRRTIVGLFEEIVDRQPDAVAVVCNDTAVSYKELNQKGNRIAHHLLTNAGVQPGETVCLAAERSIDAIAALMGIMKSGAAYVPIDPGYPAERIQHIIDNSGSRIFIHTGSGGKQAAEVVLDLREIHSPDTENVGITIRPDHLAYVMYTSGSTGKPKGTLIEHGNFMSMFVNVIGKFGVKESDRVLLFASLGFDASIFEICQALLTGAVLVIADKDKIQNTELFIRYMEHQKVTVATLPPVYLRALDGAELPYLHTLITAGEPAIAADVNFYKRSKRYINGYGPTETSVCACYHVAESAREYSGMVPIGKPSPHLTVYILDETLSPVPVGFAGELCVSGPSLARGYLKNDELTREFFIENPFDAGTRLYRTGDRARWRQDGNIEFLGRTDDQVKIRGNRIEPGEIEAGLATYGKMIAATVLDIQRGDSKELAAFIATRDAIDETDLTRHLRRFLPEYMIPLHYVFVDKIPLTHNGKIDKEALRKLPLKVPHDDTAFIPASSAMESRLIAMFEDVLDVRPVGVDDNFFALGGESLKIARLVSRIYKECRREIQFKAIVDGPTVRSIAAELESKAAIHYEDIPAVFEKDHYALSHAQKRIWILAQNMETAAVYHMPVSLLLEGALNIPALEESLKTVVQRHESLRTVFVDVNGTPYQKVLKNCRFTVESHDVSRTPDTMDRARAIVNAGIAAPFDLTYEVPVRAGIITLDRDRHILFLVVHHIAGDGISIGIMMKELSGIYNSLCSGSLWNGRPLRIQYRDYCEYEQKLIEGGKYDEEKQYWVRRLQHPLPVLELASDKSRPVVKTYSGDFAFYGIDDAVARQVITFCREQNVSLYVMMVSIVNILLHKYSSQEDIIVGSPVAGRNHPGLEDQVGVYINTVALRNQIRGGSSVMEFLKDVQKVVAEAVSNSDYPFDRLITSLNLERDTSHAPLFDVLVQIQHQNPAALTLDGVSASFFEPEFRFSKHDLTFTFVEEEQKLAFSIGYNTDLFTRARMDRAARHLRNILACVLKHPARTIREIDVLDSAEKESVKGFSSGVRKAYDTRSTVTEAFEEQAQRTPRITALVCNDTQYTYEELDERANAVAHEIRLMSKVRPDDVIGILTGRSELMVVGMLGILKAGAAYLPIDPDYPLERIAFMLRDSKAKLLLTGTDVSAIATEAARLNTSGPPYATDVLDIGMLRESRRTQGKADITASSLAYVMYTSGSTGRPKGVMIEHRSLMNLVRALSDEIYGASPAPLNIALVAPFVFDASVKQIFVALLNGHCLHIVPDDVKTNGRKLLEYYRVRRINVSDGTPVHLDILLDELRLGAPAHLPEKLIIGGQQLMHQTVRALYELAGKSPPVVTNVYGPTECCDVSTCCVITAERLAASEATGNALPIGRPIHNVQVHILDSHLARVPLGVSGELCIAGEGLARGYLGRQDLTDECFMDIDGDGSRIYRTGDRGRYLDDGNIVLSGRTDDQIKLRGFRIELAEIEQCLRNHEFIKAAAVMPVGIGEDQEIAAYYCTSQAIGSADLRRFLSLHLPACMIPSYFIELDALPSTINGKVDKKALPLPAREASGEANAPLQGDVLEEKLCAMWKELLHIERVGLTDNFFTLGGHSLIAIRLASRIHREFNSEINIWEVFQHPTISSLAALIRSKNPSLFKPIQKREESDSYPLSHAQQRLWLLARLEGQNPLYNIPAAIQLKGNLDVQAFEKAFKAIVQRHESFRTYFVEIDGVPYQKISDTVNFTIDITEYAGREWDGNTLKTLANEYCQNEFDLSKAPLLQIKLMVFSARDHLLLFNMHHIISDGWSVEVILREFEIYYDAFLHNSGNPLQPLRIQYKDYAAWQDAMLDDKALEATKRYWQNKLRKPRSLLDLPADHKRSMSLSLEGDLLRDSLDETVSKALMDMSSSRNASVFMTLLSAVYVLLHGYTGEQDIIVGSPVAGRQHYDLENQIGLFINTLVLRTEVNPENSFQELLGKVKDTVGGALDNQVYPFDRLVDELDVERIRSRNPVFDVMVAWMVVSGMGMKRTFSGLEASALEFRITKSMFDLSFLFEEHEGKVSYAIEYNTSLFSRERIHRMSDHFKTLLESITSNPQEQIKHLEILPANEKEQLLRAFNERRHPPAGGDNVIDQFNRQTGISGMRTALRYEERTMTYAELGTASNRIANHIVERFAPEKDDIIAVIVDDPLLAVASLLAVMKTGAAYLPIASENPPERISFILKDCSAKGVVVDRYLPNDPGESGAGRVMESLMMDIRGNIGDNRSLPETGIQEDSAAYVMYTSGSTGVPKGVMIEHHSLTHLMSSLREAFYCHYPGPLDELMVSSFAFDVSLKQIFASLCNGNTLHMMSRERGLDPREMAQYIVNNGINVADLTPSLFAVMLEEGFGEIDKPDLKEIFLGSEALPLTLVKRFHGLEKNKEIHITNCYGPTECCVESAHFRCHPDMEFGTHDIAPIGKAMAHEQILILDKYLHLSPIGVPGEICIAGEGVARHYVNDPEKTAEKFVDFPPVQGTRIFKTGDSGRTLPDGNIEFLGRMDEQVKVRGYRVELQEIECRLRTLKEIKECAVTLWDNDGTGVLAAYCTSDTPIDQTAITNHLSRFLPAYMLPSYFTQLERMPLSPNGKVNKKLLPDPDGRRETRTRRGPEDGIETLILSICSTILNKTGIGLEDNFFDIGGHSLNAVRLISRIQKELDVDLRLKEVFYDPVLMHIAGKVKRLLAAKETFKETPEEETVIPPISDDELKALSGLRCDDDTY